MKPAQRKHYDVIIIGAGPAGLRCAEVLAPSGLKVLLLEKKSHIGQKVCAGGVTRKFFEIYDFPPGLIEKATNQTLLTSPRRQFNIRAKENFLFTLDRKTLGQWQLARIKRETVEIQTERQVTRIEKDFVEVDSNKQYSFNFLVGADGPSSLTRRYLKIPTRHYIMAMQYKIPYRKNDIPFEIIMNSHYFHTGYAWIFPHKNYLAVGCGADPHSLSPKKMKANFHRWIKERGFDISQAAYESFPILYDYRGFRFGNIFLAGEAAGLTSGLSGEGIYPALVSGEEIAKYILDNNYQSAPMEYLLRHKKIQENIRRFLILTGPCRNIAFNLILKLLHIESFNRRLTKGFS